MSRTRSSVRSQKYDVVSMWEERCCLINLLFLFLCFSYQAWLFYNRVLLEPRTLFPLLCVCLFPKKKKKITLNEHQRKKTNANFFLQENQALTRREELLQQKIIVNITLTQIMSHKVELSFYPIEGTSMRRKFCIKIVWGPTQK